jgi:hypothetical protein
VYSAGDVDAFFDNGWTGRKFRGIGGDACVCVERDGVGVESSASLMRDDCFKSVIICNVAVAPVRWICHDILIKETFGNKWS